MFHLALCGRPKGPGLSGELRRLALRGVIMHVWMRIATFASGFVACTMDGAFLTCIFAESGKSNPPVAKMKGVPAFCECDMSTCFSDVHSPLCKFLIWII